MATAATAISRNDYPTSDGKPMAESDWHRILMVALIQTLEAWFGEAPLVYVSGNLLVFYVPGNKRKHVSPDVFVVKGVPKRQRPNYLIWEEGRSLTIVIELTSSSTRKEDVGKKFKLYQDILKVGEYFLFDPHGDYLKPPLQGYQLVRGKYVPIQLVNGRLPSKALGLHLERDAKDLRLWNPATGLWLPTPQEQVENMEEQLVNKNEEIERLRRELAELRRRLSND